MGFDSRVNIFLCSFWLIFCFLDPGIRIFLQIQIRIQEAKILQIQRIRILSTSLLGTFPKAVSQEKTFKGYLPKWKLPKSVLATALGTLDCSSRSARPLFSLQHFRRLNLTFGKLPLGKLHIWEVLTWEIVTWEVPLGKMLTP